MVGLRWTKLQDFCLRLGLLKTLTAVMPSERRSLPRDDIVARIDKAVFGRLDKVPALDSRARAAFGGDLAELFQDAKRRDVFPTVADGLLVTSTSSSWGQPIDVKTSAKIVTWGQEVGLLGQGNQITERALLLKRLMNGPEIVRFLAGDKLAWNPFTIEPKEAAFFLYHLGERDQVTWDLARAVGGLGAGSDFEATLARQLTAEAMRRRVDAIEKSGGVSRLLELRTLRELTRVIEHELGITPGASSSRPGGSLTLGSSRHAPKASKKNADHQTVPRFEALTNLGFLQKRADPGAKGRKLDQARSAWKYWVTPAAHRFFLALRRADIEPVPDWQWRRFGEVVGESGLVCASTPRRATRAEAIDQFLTSYSVMERKAGHSPFESVALHAMITALAAGLVMEIQFIHEFFIKAKTAGAFGTSVSFASGNDVDSMFLHIRPAAFEAVRELARRE